MKRIWPVIVGYAQQVWQRGAALFPENEELNRKLASAQCIVHYSPKP